MPSFRGITFQLHSQFDILTLPEYTSSLPAPLPPSPPLRHGRHQGDLDDSPISDEGFAFDDNEKRNASRTRASSSEGPLEISENKVADVYVPVYPLSQFWVGYEVDIQEMMEVVAEEEGNRGLDQRYDVEGQDEIKFVYFKLLVNGEDTVEWGVRARRDSDDGEHGACRGKVMFALFQRRERQAKALEKRGFFFQGGVEEEDEDGIVDCKEEEGVIEIRVYRARGRRRVGRKARVAFEDEEEMGVSLQIIGNTAATDPQHYYEYALIDAKDEPYAVIRYHVCTTDQLLALGIVPGNRHDQTGERTSSVDADSLNSLEPEHLSSGDADTNAGAEDQRSHTLSPGDSKLMAQRLSSPPAKRLTSTTSIHEPSSPIKKPSHPKDSLENMVLDRSTSLRDLHPTFGRIFVRTPSPGTSEDRIAASASPEEVQNARPNALQVLKGVFDSALRRRGRDRLSPNSLLSGADHRLLGHARPLNGASTASPISTTSSMGSLHSPARVVNVDETMGRSTLGRSASATTS
ncbi:hypothetical protein MBLNU457_6211t1 [Dothideomycetes sp. NU457]